MADMADIERIGVKQARGKAHQALLVCAYESEAKHGCSIWTARSRWPISDLGWLRCRRRRKSFSIERDRPKRALSVRQPNTRRKALPTSKCSRAVSKHGKLLSGKA